MDLIQFNQNEKLHFRNTNILIVFNYDAKNSHLSLF